MAAIDFSGTGHAAAKQGRIGQVFASAFAALRSWNDARIARNALMQLSDRELDDIGLCRGDIDAIVEKHR